MRKKYYLSACCILKDEEPFIFEWLTYHSLIGVEHFFIYDNESKNPVAAHPLIQKFAVQNKVTVLNTPGKIMQYPAYNHCLKNFGPLSKWIAFIDLDEFICPQELNDLRPLLAAYEDYAALGLSWKCFNSGGHLSRPKGLVIKNYQERFLKETRGNLHIKSIIQPEKNYGVHTPHSFFPNSGEVAVSAHFRPITSGTAMIPICWEKATVHHYVLKSQQDAQRRMERGRADISSDKPTIDYSAFYRMVAEPVEHDDSILRFAPEVETWLQAGELPESYAELLSEIEPEKLLGMAEVMLQNGKPDDAGIILCHAASSQSENPRLWQLRARIAASKGEDNLLRLFTEKSARIKAGLPAALYPKPGPDTKLAEAESQIIENELRSLINAAKLQEVEDRLDALEKKYRLSTYMWVLRGEAARKKGDLAKAEEYLFTALGMDERLDTYKALAQLRIDQGNIKDARDLVFYLINTGTYRAENPEFYTPLKDLFELLKKVTDN